MSTAHDHEQGRGAHKRRATSGMYLLDRIANVEVARGENVAKVGPARCLARLGGEEKGLVRRVETAPEEQRNRGASGGDGVAT